mmetsp:Transcript_9840/g.41851  ORF Transcript_9840/g.41851 Transcript_9840/m.41851 type:complete len:363 (-) Transcript_9840:718-1806(-)
MCVSSSPVRTRLCRHSGLTSRTTSVTVLGGLSGSTHARIVPGAPSWHRISISKRVWFSEGSRYTASAPAPPTSSGGVRETIAVVAAEDESRIVFRESDASTLVDASSAPRTFAAPAPYSSSRSTCWEETCTATLSIAAGASRVKRCVAVSGSSRNRSSTRLGPSAAIKSPLKEAYFARATCTSASSRSVSSLTSSTRFLSAKRRAAACASSSASPIPNPSALVLSAPGLNETTLPLKVCAKISGKGVVTRPCLSVCTASPHETRPAICGSPFSSNAYVSMEPSSRPITTSFKPSPVKSHSASIADTPPDPASLCERVSITQPRATRSPSRKSCPHKPCSVPKSTSLRDACSKSGGSDLRVSP